MIEKPTPQFLVAIALVACFSLSLRAGFWLDDACLSPGRRIVMKQLGGVGCFEFWFNRYQSLIGNVLTALVAGATLIWVARQLVAANRQAAVAAAEGLRQYTKELEAEVDNYRIAIWECEQYFPQFLASIETQNDDIKSDPEIFIQMHQKIYKFMSITNRFEVQHNSIIFIEYTQSLHSFIFPLLDNLSAISIAVVGYQSMPNTTDRIAQFNEITQLMRESASAIRMLQLTAHALVQALYAELRIVWTKIREFEQIAVNGGRAPT